MNKNEHNTDLRCSTWCGALFLVCLLPATVFAGTLQTTQQHNNKPLVSPVEATVVAVTHEQGINKVVVAPTGRALGVHDKDDAVIVQDEGILSTALISVAFMSSDNQTGLRQSSAVTDSAQRSVGRTGNEWKATSEHGDTLRIPYSLVLVLFALIGLVPVSRRNR